MGLTVADLRTLLLESMQLDPEDEQLAHAERIQDVVAMDSVAFLQFVVALEAKYGVTLDEEWLTIDRLADLPALAAHLRDRIAADSGGPLGR